MPKRSEPPYFAVVCTDQELRRQLEKSGNSEFWIAKERMTGVVTVHDGDTLVLRAERFGWWFVKLHRKYFRHPFSPPLQDDSLPGIP